jgi:hypothetical protein
MSDEPVVPKSRVTVPSACRTERPRHLSVKNIAPSPAKAMSQGLLRPWRTTVRVSAGVSVAGGVGGVGVLAGSSGEPPQATARSTAAAATRAGCADTIERKESMSEVVSFRREYSHAEPSATIAIGCSVVPNARRTPSRLRGSPHR